MTDPVKKSPHVHNLIELADAYKDIARAAIRRTEAAHAFDAAQGRERIAIDKDSTIVLTNLTEPLAAEVLKSSENLLAVTEKYRRLWPKLKD